MGSWPENVGIVTMEMIFPSYYVDQTELEVFDGVSAGKYTIGLGQDKMGFCTDREDINSLCLTVVHNLMEKHHLKYSDIGRLEVGTETVIDKSKSVKTVLMQLFEPHGVVDLEGVDSTNACYGGTAALFNALSWVESSAWNGRYALVVTADIAVYAKGSARPTGGAGAVAMLIGPNAPLVIDRGLRAIYMRHAYDFYKPNLSSEYPVVDGKLSIQCYLNALDKCYQSYCKKASKQQGRSICVKDIDYFLFHSPYCKLVQKSLSRLVLNDIVQLSTNKVELEYPDLKKYKDKKLEECYFDKEIEKVFVNYSNDLFEKKTKASLLAANQIGNMYTASLYGSLVSLLVGVNSVEDLLGKRVVLFSYGSGLASSMYSITISSNKEDISKLVKSLKHVQLQLKERRKVSPEKFSSILELREKNCHAAPYEPSGTTEDLFPGTYYLIQVDEMHRRKYQRIPAYVNGST
ncbi:hydroxymethylglutaryl-CoA synthase 1 [Agrilus planipennis]|uniref:Hydroxymethylglutaryl-CoA synthase n=1 Tax=Agrilus planipennis TaxID=224129 RepID=A0A1W4WFW6_AGRPL|nr:hydroxymethylglutaryl-CoA synthase 1 [Agrilus planipennis]